MAEQRQQAQQQEPQRKAVIVGISGCSSSGKTTLARLLRDLFPRTIILHEDDFYKPEVQFVWPVLHSSPFFMVFPC